MQQSFAKREKGRWGTLVLTLFSLILVAGSLNAGCNDSTAEKSKAVDPASFGGRRDRMPAQQRQAMEAGIKAAQDAQKKAQEKGLPKGAPR